MKADDPGRKRTIQVESGRSWFKADDLLSQSRRSLSQSGRSRVKADDLLGWKQTIHQVKADDSIRNLKRVKANDLRALKQTTQWVMVRFRLRSCVSISKNVCKDRLISFTKINGKISSALARIVRFQSKNRLDMDRPRWLKRSSALTPQDRPLSSGSSAFDGTQISELFGFDIFIGGAFFRNRMNKFIKCCYPRICSS